MGSFVIVGFVAKNAAREVERRYTSPKRYVYVQEGKLLVGH